MHQPVIQLADIHRGQLVDVLVVNTEGQRFLVEAGAMTFRTHVGTGELLGPLAGGGRCICLFLILDVLYHPFIADVII